MGYFNNYFPSAASGGSSAETPPSVWQAFASTRGPDGTRPSTTDGTAVTPGTAGARGVYANLGVLSATHDMLEIEILVHTVNVSGSNRMVSIDIAVDTAGGSSFTGNDKITDLLVGAPGALHQGLESRFTFPLRIPAGASVGVRGTSLDATLTDFRVIVTGRGNPTKSTLVKYGTAVQTLGVATPATVQGTAVTVSTTVGTDGTWAEVGTLAQDVFALEAGVIIDNVTIATNEMHFDVAVGDAGTKRIVISNRSLVCNTSETVARSARWWAFTDAVAGEKVYVRAHALSAQTGVQAAVYGVY